MRQRCYLAAKLAGMVEMKLKSGLWLGEIFVRKMLWPRGKKKYGRNADREAHGNGTQKTGPGCHGR